ncbi:hypothetical protein ACB094_12G074300 [Castanea mollissima]
MFTEAITVNGPKRLENIQVPKKASYIIVIMLELSRIASHLLWLGPFMANIGAQTPFFYIFKGRELVYDLFEAAMGVAANLPYGWTDKCLDFCDYFLTGVTGYQKLITRNPIFLERVKGVGIIGRDEEVQWQKEGDSLARYLVRIGEMAKSIKIIQQAKRYLKWHDFEYRFISKKPSPTFELLKQELYLVKRMKLANIMTILETKSAFTPSFYRVESLKGVYGIIWVLVSILTLVLGITIGLLVIVWLEREISTGLQQRIGPEYSGPLGVLQALADGTKLLFKENLLPSRGDTWLFSIGPSIAVIAILLNYSVIPFDYYLVLADLNIRVFFFIASIGLLISRYGSNNKYSFLGGL